jgi:hypothetical protein
MGIDQLINIVNCGQLGLKTTNRLLKEEARLTRVFFYLLLPKHADSEFTEGEIEWPGPI